MLQSQFLFAIVTWQSLLLLLIYEYIYIWEHSSWPQTFGRSDFPWSNGWPHFAWRHNDNGVVLNEVLVAGRKENIHFSSSLHKKQNFLWHQTWISEERESEKDRFWEKRELNYADGDAVFVFIQIWCIYTYYKLSSIFQWMTQRKLYTFAVVIKLLLFIYAVRVYV